MATEARPRAERMRLYLLPAAPGDPHAQRNRADDEQDAQELETRRVIGLPGHDAGGSARGCARLTASTGPESSTTLAHAATATA